MGTVSAIPEHLFKYASACTQGADQLQTWVRTVLGPALRDYQNGGGVCSVIDGEVAQQVAAAYYTDQDVKTVGLAFQVAGGIGAGGLSAPVRVDEKQLAGAYQTVLPLPKPPRPNKPKSNAQWWKGLSADQRAALLVRSPKLVGALDGLPAEVRDQANRTVLAQSWSQYQLKLAEWRKTEPQRYTYSVIPTTGQFRTVETDEWKKWNRTVQDLQGRIDAMNNLQKFLNASNNGLPQAYLLGFDPEGRGHDGKVIVARGNPDSAQHTAIFVPGTHSHITKIAPYLGRMDALWTESNKNADGKQVSIITWLDYDAPINVRPGDHGAPLSVHPEDQGTFQATDPKFAQLAAPTLRVFAEGIRASHVRADGVRTHTTLIGHSYGSTVVGEAAKWGTARLPVDDIVVAGSPGMQVDRAADLRIGSNHVYAMDASGMDDAFVTQGGRLVGLGDWGVIPTDRSFGGTILKSGVSGHTDYWNTRKDRDGNPVPVEALRNQALVVAGKGSKASHENPHWWQNLPLIQDLPDGLPHRGPM